MMESSSTRRYSGPGRAGAAGALSRGMLLLPLLLLCLAAMTEGAEGKQERWVFREEVVKSWHAQDGLPSNHVTALAQTREGWLWVGTSAGLARFDGARFALYGEKEGLPQVWVERLTALPDGRLWISLETHRRFWLEAGKIRRDESGFRDVVVGGDGRVYGVGPDRVTILPEGAEGPGKEIPLPRSSKRNFGAFGASADGTLWYCPVAWVDPNEDASPAVWRYDAGEEEWRVWEEWEGTVLPEGRRAGGVAMTADSGGTVWLAFPSGVVAGSGSGERQEWRLPPKPDLLLNFIRQGRDGETWMKAAGGISTG